MSINILNTRLEAINEKCEKKIKLKLSKFYNYLDSDNPEFNPPSPQVIESLWFDLIAEKEHKFISEITLILSNPDASLSIEDASSIEKTINNVFSESQYLLRMREFYKQLNEAAIANETAINSSDNKIDLIDSAYQEGVSKVLHKARNQVLAKLEFYKKNDLGMIEIWKKYSTLSPLGAISTILLLYCTTLLISWIIKGDTFQQYLEQFGW
mgnify:FL=1|jgi:hypothetical protein